MPEDGDVNIGIVAVQSGLITSAQLAEAIEEAKRLKEEGKENALREVLVSRGFVTEEQADELAQNAEKTAAPDSGRIAHGTVKMKLEGEVLYADEVGEDLLGGDFRIVKKVGSGGMGAVYLAEQVSLQRKVALKMISPEAATDKEYVARFKREATSAAQLVHPNIVQVHSIGEHQGMWYIAMEYVEGKSVGDMLKEHSPMDVTVAANYIAQALKGLARAHSMNIIHRDIKPDNLMVNEDGEVKIADFGLARMTAAQDVSLTMSGAVMGTPHYMSPQQAEGKELNQQADIYSLGATFYHMVTGLTPFTGDSAMSILYKAGTGKAPAPHKRNARVPIELSRLIEKMMARDLAVRYATCDEVLKDLSELGYLGETAAEARRRQSIPIIAGVAALILIIGGVGFYFMSLYQADPKAGPVEPAPVPGHRAGPVVKPEPAKGPVKPDNEKPVVDSGREPAVDDEKPEPPTSDPQPQLDKPKRKLKPRPALDVAVITRPDTTLPVPEPEPVKPAEPPKPPPIDVPTLPPLPKAKKTITVKAGGGGDYKTLAEAVGALPAELKESIRIDVHAGEYEGPIKIGGDTGTLADKNNCVCVRAVGDGPVVIKAGAEKNSMWINRTDHVTVDGLIFQGSGGSRGINVLRSRFFRVRRCVFVDCEEGVFSITTGGEEKKEYWSEFSDCLFVNNKSAIVLDDSSKMVIRNSLFVGNKNAALKLLRFNGSILLNIFSIPASGDAINLSGGKRLTGNSSFSTQMNYNCYTGKGEIFESGTIHIKDIEGWKLRYQDFDKKSFHGDPGFRDAKKGDFRLSDKSKCKANLPEDTPMGVRWAPEQWQTYLAWWKGRKK